LCVAVSCAAPVAITKRRGSRAQGKTGRKARGVTNESHTDPGTKRRRKTPLAMRSEDVLATDLFRRDELVWEEHYVKTIIRSFAGSGVHLRDSERARTAARSSTNAHSAG